MLGYLNIMTIMGRKRILHLPAPADTVTRCDRADHGMLARLMLAWRRNRQKQLELHLMLTTPSHRWKRRDTLFRILSPTTDIVITPTCATELHLRPNVNEAEPVVVG
jgi:hypothetical protein